MVLKVLVMKKEGPGRFPLSHTSFYEGPRITFFDNIKDEKPYLNFTIHTNDHFTSELYYEINHPGVIWHIYLMNNEGKTIDSWKTDRNSDLYK